MTAIENTSADLQSLDASALILGVNKDGEVIAHPQLDEEARAALSAAGAALDASGKLASCTVVPGTGISAGRAVLVGVGDGSAGALREAAGAAARQVGKKATTVAVALTHGDDALAAAVAEGVLLGGYQFLDYKSAAEDEDDDGITWLVAGADETVLERAMVVAGAVMATRDLVNTAPVDLFPGSFAEVAQGFAQKLGVTCEVWEPERLYKEGFGGLLGVGMGSSRPPRLVRLEWAPADAKETIALVGKGITFDSGGLSLKQPKPMETMKSDMAGAASVMHIVLAAARLQLPLRITGYLCLAENLPSATAQRPSDIIKIYGGTTVEVLNTDAEGRLVLADGLTKAREDSPAVLLDIATLTGAQGIALGSRTSGVMGSPEVRDAIVAAADAAGELMWAMPLPGHLRESLDSPIADLKNIGDPNGGMLSAGVFLKEFVGDTPWAHLDIARPAFNEGSAWGYTPGGGTGVAVRTVLRFLEERARA